SGAPISRQKRRAPAASSKVANRAVGIPWRRIRSFEKAFEPSIAAARAPGPKTVSPAAAKRSARPATSGASGPITVRSIRSRREGDEILVRIDPDRDATRVARDARVAGRGEQRVDQRTLGNLPGQRVLAAATADD